MRRLTSSSHLHVLPAAGKDPSGYAGANPTIELSNQSPHTTNSSSTAKGVMLQSRMSPGPEHLTNARPQTTRSTHQGAHLATVLSLSCVLDTGLNGSGGAGFAWPPAVQYDRADIRVRGITPTSLV